jgi:ABC-type uncharacterized transport system involved in gliding motility auxiliary subunit
MKAILKYLKYLFWLGPMLVVAGISAGVVSGSWSPIPLGLVIAGTLIIALWLVFLGQLEQKSELQPGFWGRRSTQVGTNALVATVAVVVILGLVNFLAVRHVTRIDLTENQLFTLAPQSRELVRNLKQPVKVWVFDRNQNPQDRELLERYQEAGSQFSFEFVDPQVQFSLAQQFEAKKFGDVYLELSPVKRRQYVQTVNDQERLSEVKLTNALEQISRDRPVTVYFLQGHGERPLEQGQGAMTQAVAALKNKNYSGKPLNLAEAANFPEDADVVVVAGPQKALLASEVKALEAYLNRGGNVLLLADPLTNPGLDSLLDTWGVTLDQRVAIDASRRITELGPADSVVSRYGEHPITRDFGNNFSFYSFARPLQIKSVSGVQSTSLLFTSDRSWAESNIQAQPLKFDQGGDQPGPLTLGIALTRPTQPPPTPKPTPTPTPSPSPSPNPQSSPPPLSKESRLVVIGNASFATDGLFDRLLNGDVFLNSVRWLSQQDQQTLSIRPREAKNRRITLTAQQASLAGWLAIGILPLLGFGTAAVVWWKRR